MTRAAPPDRIEFLGLRFATLDMAAVTDWLGRRTATQPFAYVITPNVDHAVQLQKGDALLRRTFEDADLCVCDSRVLGRLARLRGLALPIVPGSDLTGILFARLLAPGDRICLIGAAAETAALLRAAHPELAIVHYEPPMGLLTDPAARTTTARTAAAAGARFILLAVGSPQSELIAHEIRQVPGAAGTALCIGASVEFLVGVQSRAPRPVQRLGLEWAWRLATQPRRLWRRYLVDGMAIFPMAMRWRRTP